MKIFVILVAFIAVATATETGANELWRKQMQRLDEIVAENKLSRKPEEKKQDRQIGLPFFGVDFEDEPNTFTTVHSLRPQDIDVIGAMGDSLTAANGAGASTVPEIAIEYRGMCFSVGGDSTVEESITLPNIIKKFNPRLDGYSTGLGTPLLYEKKYGFNVAVPGARADDMYGQAVRLIQLLKTDNRSRWEDDWKLVTLFIGGNDLCALGRDPEGASPETYVAEIKRSLDLLHAEVPRMFVNVVDILEIYLLPYVGYGYGSTPQCRAAQQSFCGHVVNTMDDEEAQAELRAINKQYQVQLQALIDSGIYDTRDDFTVIVQPFLRDTVLPYTEYGEVDATYFAPDCFHFSDIGHAMGALNLWNNMLEPVGAKSTVWNITDLKVPTEERPYLFTYKNSDITPPNGVSPSPGPEEESTEVEVWVIVVIAILVVFLAAEAIALVVVLGKDRGTSKASMVSDYEKGGHDNGAAIKGDDISAGSSL